jgi:aminoglycoside 6-adenylyltransferase
MTGHHRSSRGDPDAAAVAESYERLIGRFVAWAGARDDVRAAVVIGSRARTDHPADAWADLDVIVLAVDPDGLARDAGWAAEIGEPWISFVEPTPDGAGVERRVLFAGGLDVDFAVFGVQVALADDFLGQARDVVSRGFRVLLDKDDLLTGLGALAAAAESAPTPPPDAAALLQAASDFWYHAVWTAKHLRRGELWWAKSGCDIHMKGLLRQVLEWDAALDGRDPWFRGRFLEEWADPAVLARLPQAFAAYDEADVWRALTVTMDLFADVARRVAERRSLPYRSDVEERARQLVRSYRTVRR